jgi:hypothetical protein
MTVNINVGLDCCPIMFGYTNHRGETSQRRATPSHIAFEKTPWHGPQWIMWAFDLDKLSPRAFAMKDMTDVVFSPVPNSDDIP